MIVQMAAMAATTEAATMIPMRVGLLRDPLPEPLLFDSAVGVGLRLRVGMELRALERVGVTRAVEVVNRGAEDRGAVERSTEAVVGVAVTVTGCAVVRSIAEDGGAVVAGEETGREASEDAAEGTVAAEDAEGTALILLAGAEATGGAAGAGIKSICRFCIRCFGLCSSATALVAHAARRRRGVERCMIQFDQRTARLA